MLPTHRDGPRVRLIDLLAMLSLASDLAFGQPAEYGMRACLVAMRLAGSLGLDRSAQRDTYYVALLRWIGCTSHAHELSVAFGDEIAARARFALVDFGRPAEVLLELVRHSGEGRPLAERLRVLASVLAAGSRTAEYNFRTSCEVARLLAARLGFEPPVLTALTQTFERWDGRGFPAGVAGDRIALPARITQLAYDLEVFMRDGGPETAVSMARRRSGGAYDPGLVDCLRARASELLAPPDEGKAWEQLAATEPEPQRWLHGDRLDAALEVLADYADLKSPFTGGHSRGVAALAAEAALGSGLSEGEARDVRRAGLVHDLGRAGVPNSIWDKPGPLTPSEQERVRLHPYYTERALARVPPLAPLLDAAALHHERLDGFGYHRGLKGAQLPFPAQLVAAADGYHAMLEPRSHRPERTPEAAAGELRAMVRAGRLGSEAVEAVLAAAGHRTGRHHPWPAGLTGREVEVLRLAARGASNKEIARALSISDRTIAHHVQHIYEKIGVSTRGAAALFAIEHGLLQEVRK